MSVPTLSWKLSDYYTSVAFAKQTSLLFLFLVADLCLPTGGLGESSRRIQVEFPELRKRYWGRRFWARGYFSTTSGNVTDDIIKQYLELHSSK